MQINPVSHSQKTFGTIKFANGAEDVLKKLSESDLKYFVKQAKKQNKNIFVDITLFSKDNENLSARIIDKTHNIQGKRREKELQTRWYFFESRMKFLDRCCEQADKRTKKIIKALKKQKLLENIE